MRTIVGRRLHAIVVAVAVVVVFASASPAAAAGARLIIRPGSHTPTAPVQVRGSGFGASERISILLDTQKLATTSTDAAGIFSSGFTIPASVPPGTHIVTAIGGRSGLRANSSLIVTTSWPQFHFDGGNRYNPFENVLGPSNVSDLEERWAFKPGAPWESSPVVANGTVFGLADGDLYAVRADTGRVRWVFGPATYLEAEPAVAGDLVYIGGPDGFVYAVDAETGTQRWRTATGYRVTARLVVAEGVVYAGVCCGAPGGTWALDAETGTVLWESTAGEDGEIDPVVGDGRVFVADFGSRIRALDAATGTVLWTFHTGAVEGGTSSVAAIDGVVYVGSWSYGGLSGYLHAVSAATGQELWRIPSGSGTSTPAVANGVVYVGSNDGIVYARDASTGNELWTYASGGTNLSSPAIANGVVYLGADSAVLALDVVTGLPLGSLLTVCCAGSPVVSDGMVIVVSERFLRSFGLPAGA